MNGIIENLNLRWNKAIEAFTNTLNPPKKEKKSSPSPRPPKSVAGWLIPVEESQFKAVTFETCELSYGDNYVEYKDGLEISQSPNPNAAQTTIISVEKGRMIIIQDQKPKQQLFHGDRVQLFDQNYKVSLLSARAYLKWFGEKLHGFFLAALTSLFLTGCMGNAIAQKQNSEKASLPQTPPEIIEISQSEMIRAPFDSIFSLEFSVPGLHELDLRKLSAKVRAGGDEYQLPLKAAIERKSNYHILVDTSSLCLKRNKEDKINLEISQFIKSLDHDSKISLSEFYRIEDQLIFDTVFENKLAKDHSDRDEFITCRASAHSANAIAAIARTRSSWEKLDKKQNQSKVEADWRRNIAIVFTSGNVKPFPKASQVIRDFDLDVYTVVYSPVETAYAKRVLSGVTEIHDGKSYWWKKSRTLNFTDLFPFMWKFSFQTRLPYELKEKSYPFEIEILRGNQKFRIFSDIRYYQDERALFFYRLRTILYYLLIFGISGYAIYRIYHYYRTPKCSKTGYPLSRSWNRSLFSSKGKFPLLIVKKDQIYEKSHILDQKITKIGSRFNDDLKVKLSGSTPGLTIKLRGYETYELNPEGSQTQFVVNGIERSSSLYLKHGDRIEIQNTELLFLFQNSNDEKNHSVEGMEEEYSTHGY